MKVQYGVAIDQYGNRFYFGKHCRKELAEQLNRKHVSKMYRDKKDGSAVHIGYIIAGRWLTVFGRVEEPAGF